MVWVRPTELVTHVRSAIAAGTSDLATYGLVRLSGGMNHDVFVPTEAPNLVVKVFRPVDYGAAEHEWGALVALASNGIAPDPIHFDLGSPPIVVMSRVSGCALPGSALGADHALRIDAAHRLVHLAAPWHPIRRPPAGIRSAQKTFASDEWPDMGTSIEMEAWRAAKGWIANVDIDELFWSPTTTFSHGDPNLTNYLWSENGLVLIDWEYSDFSDPVLELANVAEHASTRTLQDEFLATLFAAADLSNSDLARLASGRRVMSCFWLELISRRQRLGLPTTVTVEEQALRTLAVLDL